jgi:hypothetical protein
MIKYIGELLERRSLVWLIKEDLFEERVKRRETCGRVG